MIKLLKKMGKREVLMSVPVSDTHLTLPTSREG